MQNQISNEEIYKVLLELKAKMQNMDKYIEDLEFARQVAESWERYDKGEFKSLPKEKFLKELDKW